MDRTDALAGAWLYVGAAIAATALVRGGEAGGLATAGDTGFFLGGALVLVFGIRDVLGDEHHELARYRNSTLFVAATAATVAVVTYSLTAAAGVL
jgi:hypothetical protein